MAKLREKPSDKMLAGVRELLEINIDSHDGLVEASARIQDVPLSEIFREIASQRLAQSAALLELLGQDSRRESAQAPARGRNRRRIMDWRDASAGNSAEILKAVERGEEYLTAKYEALLSRSPGTASELLRIQYKNVKACRQLIRNLRRAAEV